MCVWCIGRCYRKAIDEGLKHVLFSTVASSSNTDVQVLLSLSYEDLLPYIQEDLAFRALISCLELLCNIMISFHSVLRACK